MKKGLKYTLVSLGSLVVLAGIGLGIMYVVSPYKVKRWLGIVSSYSDVFVDRLKGQSYTRGGYDGIDVSKHNGVIKWKEIAKNKRIKFVYIRATHGKGYVDRHYRRNIRLARKYGLKVGSYHLMSAGSSATAQFWDFQKMVKKGEQDLIPVLDVEEKGIQGRWKGRGPGETEIETDRRIIRDKITRLKEQLEKIDKQMVTQRKNRGKLVRVALVGYTNVGKSTLMNLLSKSEVFAENKLFATLDTTVRKIAIKNVPFLLADTVGFIRKLPHHLVESFKSTLDEVREADVILHVVDISHPQFEDQVRIVNETLSELIDTPKPTITVFNKIDAFTYTKKDEDDLTPIERKNYSLDDLKQMWMSKQGEETVYISAKGKENIDELKEKLYDIVKDIHSARFPFNDFLYQEYEEE